MELSVAQLAHLVNGDVDGNPNVVINNYCKIEEGEEGCITFLANPKYTHFAYETKASAIIVSRDFVPEQPIAATLIRVDDPYATIAQLLNIANSLRAERRGIEQPVFVAEGTTPPDDIYIGAFAYVGKNVTFGKNVKIYPQAYVGDGVTIGDNVKIYPGVKIYHGCVIGNNVTIHAGSVIGSDGFGFAPQADGSFSKIAQIGNVIIEDNVEIGANVTIDRATMGSTIIRQGVKLDNLIQVAHNVEIGENTVMAAQVGIAGSTKIGKNCMVGGQVGFAGHITVADGCGIGAQAGVPNSIKQTSRVIGAPAIPALEFARQQVFFKRLPQMADDIKQLKNALKNITNND